MPPSLDNLQFKTWLPKSWNIWVTPWTCLTCLMCVAWKFWNLILCHSMSFHNCLRSAPHATLAGRKLFHFIVWVFSLAFLMFMCNDCGPSICGYKRHRECVAMAFQHHACWGQDLLWPELLQCGKKARESHLRTCLSAVVNFISV